MKKYNLVFVLCIFISFCSCSDDDVTIEEPQSFPEIINGTISHQNMVRKYSLHIPDSYDGTEEFPLVVFLHGGGGNAESAQNFTNFNSVSEQNEFLMLYPQAGFELDANSFVWADGRGLAPDNLGIDDVGFINSLVDSLEIEYNVNPNKIYLCGFSNGSFLTQKIAFEMNSQFTAMGTLGGTMSQEFFDSGNPNRVIPMMYVFGTDDPLVPYNGGFVSGNQNLEPVVSAEDAVAFWVSNNQCQTTLAPVELPNINTNDNSTVTVFEYTNGNCQNSKVKFYRINNGGHTWPGVNIQNQSLGQTNLDIQASEELWEFFDQFELCI